MTLSSGDQPARAESSTNPKPARPIRERMTPKPDTVSYPSSGSGLWNIPNGLTMLRLVLVIPFAVLLFGYGTDSVARAIAALIFVIAAVTDFFDGALARKYNIVTNFGKIADPLADKALTGVALIGLSYLSELPWWVTTVILVREIGVTLLRFWVIRHGVIAASRGGKAKTVALLIAIFLYLLPLTGPMSTVRAWVMGIAVVLALVTGADYVARAIKLRNKSTREKRSVSST